MPKDIQNPRHEMFCQYYVGAYDTFGNATKSYAKAYDKDVSSPPQYATCRTEGYRLLTIPDIIKRINELLKDLIMNDTSVDSELAFVIMQRKDLSSKMRAIQEYNKLNQRITDKAEIHINPIREIIEKYGGGKGDDIGELPTTEERPS